MAAMDGAERQAAIYVRGVSGRRPRVPIAVEALERAAARHMSREAFAYVAACAGNEATKRANQASWETLVRETDAAAAGVIRHS
jgi:lactate 2-monooxygenase